MRPLLPFVAGVLLTISAAVVAQVYNFFPPPGSTVTTNAVLVGAASNSLASVALTADRALFGTATTPQATAVTDCTQSNQALTYSTTSHTFSCRQLAIIVAKGGDTSRANTATPTADPDILVGSVVTGTWMLSCDFIVSLPSTNGGWQSELTFSGTSTISNFRYLYVDQFTGAAPISDAQAFGALTSTAGHSGATSTVEVTYQGTFVVTAPGNVGLSWAQATTNANGTVLKTGSGCNIVKIG
jgi:hypothetical protein